METSNARLCGLLEEAIRTQRENAIVDEGVTPQDVGTAMGIVMRDNPDIFWLDGQRGFEVAGRMVSFRYAFPKEDVGSIKDAIRGVVENGFHLDSAMRLPEALRVLRVHKWLASHCRYDADPARDRGIFGVFIKGEASSAGYAKAAQYLLGLLGIEARTVFGHVHGSPEGSRHCWNLVRVNGRHYHLDTCPGGGDAGGPDLRLFCVSTAEMAATRSIEGEDTLPPCDESIGGRATPLLKRAGIRDNDDAPDTGINACVAPAEGLGNDMPALRKRCTARNGRAKLMFRISKSSTPEEHEFADICCCPNQLALGSGTAGNEGCITYLPNPGHAGSGEGAFPAVLGSNPEPGTASKPLPVTSGGLGARIYGLADSMRNRLARREAYASVFAPARAMPGTRMLVQVYLHRAGETGKVVALAGESDRNAERRDYVPLRMRLKRGDVVDVHLRVHGDGPVFDGRQSMTWLGHFDKCSFTCLLPQKIAARDLECEAMLSVNGLPVGEMRFVTQVSAGPHAKANTKVEPRNYNRIFLSYAHQDYGTVRNWANAYRAIGVHYFFDRHTLRGGDVHLERILEGIDSADLFILYWSRNAERSEYVDKERKYAMSRAYPQVSLEDARLRIYPISIEPRADLPADMRDVYNFEIL